MRRGPGAARVSKRLPAVARGCDNRSLTVAAPGRHGKPPFLAGFCRHVGKYPRRLPAALSPKVYLGVGVRTFCMYVKYAMGQL